MKTILYTLILLLALFGIEILYRIFFDANFGYTNSTPLEEKIIVAFWTVYSVIIYFVLLFAFLSIFPIHNNLKHILALGIVLGITVLLSLDKTENKGSAPGAWISMSFRKIHFWTAPGLLVSRTAENFADKLLSSGYKKMAIDELLTQQNISVLLKSDMHRYNGDYYGYIKLWDKRKNSKFLKNALIKIDENGKVAEIPKNYSHFKKILPVGKQLMLQDASSKNEFHLPNMDFKSIEIDNFPDRIEYLQVFDDFIYGYAKDYAGNRKEANDRIIRFNDTAIIEVVSHLKALELLNQKIYGFRPLSSGNLWVLSFDDKQKRLHLLQLDKNGKVIQTTPHQIHGEDLILETLRLNSRVDENGEWFESMPFEYNREFQPQIDSNGNVLILGKTTFTKENTLLRITKEGLFDKKFNRNIAATDYDISAFNFIEKEKILIAGHKNKRFVVAIVNPDGTLIKTIYKQKK